MKRLALFFMSKKRGRDKKKRKRRQKSFLRRSVELGAIGSGIGTLGLGAYALANGGKINRKFLIQAALKGGIAGASLPTILKIESELAKRYPQEYGLATKAGLLYGAYALTSNRGHRQKRIFR